MSPSLTRPDVLPAEERPSEASPCPVAGEYEGVIPDTGDQLGAKLYSDCNSPGIMFYSVLSLDNHSIVYEGEAAGRWEMLARARDRQQSWVDENMKCVDVRCMIGIVSTDTFLSGVPMSYIYLHAEHSFAGGDRDVNGCLTM